MDDVDWHSIWMNDKLAITEVIGKVVDDGKVRVPQPRLILALTQGTRGTMAHIDPLPFCEELITGHESL